MSLDSKILLLTQKITHAINSVQGTVGDLANLPTLDKANIVASLIEIKNDIDTINQTQQNLINDGTISHTNTWSSYKIDQEIVQAITDLIDGAPDWLNTLKELASTLQNDPNIITSLSNMVAKRVAVDSVQSFSSIEKDQGRANIDAASQSDLNAKQNDLGDGPNGTFLAYDRTWKPVTKSSIGLSNVTNDAQIKLQDLDTDVTLQADSDTKVPSQHAIKYYVDNKNWDAGTY